MSNVREAFDKSITNGSMNVNKFSKLLEDVPYVRVIAPLVGATVDKYGRKTTMGAVDATIWLNRKLQEEGVQSYMNLVRPLMEKAAKGNIEASVTLQLLSKSNGIPLKYETQENK
jgi:hypothetical protein